MSLHFYLYVALVAAACMAILGIFKRSLLSRLSTRIAVLIFISGPLTLALFPISTKLFAHIGLAGAPHPFATLLLYALITLCVPVVLGLLAALFVRRPLHQFNEAVASLEQSNYKVRLRPTGIHEFDEVFTKFNNLIHRLRHEEKLRKDLVSDTSHELNTPLAVMIGQLTAMQEGKHSATKERITVLKQQAERLTELVQQLDAYTKARMPDAGESEDIHLRQFCEKLVHHFSLELKQKGIEAKLDITDDLTIPASRNTLQQILTNLMQNALRYSGATQIVISASARQLIFSDNGKGVPAESLPYLFERFYRVDTSRDRTTGGLGLGLAIVKELTEQQGWHIHAEHAKPGLAFVLGLE